MRRCPPLRTPRPSPRELLPLLLEHQERHRKAEIDSRQCLSGPHKDDLSVKIGGQEAKTYASQGQTRTAALSLKLAQREIFQEETGEWPVLLLDDVLSELDPRRQAFVLNRIRGGPGVHHLLRGGEAGGPGGRQGLPHLRREAGVGGKYDMFDVPDLFFNSHFRGFRCTISVLPVQICGSKADSNNRRFWFSVLVPRGSEPTAGGAERLSYRGRNYRLFQRRNICRSLYRNRFGWLVYLSQSSSKEENGNENEE